MRRSTVLAVAVLTLCGCAALAQTPGEDDRQSQGDHADHNATHTISVPQRYDVEVLEVIAHDPEAFTQGFEIADGILYEGTGLVGESSLRATDPATGEVLDRVELPQPLFGEGITVVDDRIWQLTWRDNVALLRDRETLAEVDRVEYPGEGWGICYDGSRLVMSDGTDQLHFRDPETFELIDSIRVTQEGQPKRQLNELECVDDQVFSNVWYSDDILRIDPTNGEVTGVVDASDLLPADQQAAADVLNGIAAIPDTDEFLVTGKHWPSTFRVRFVPSD
ncbi:glutaminyl-peptide cyclotransferase [Actinoalloteichus hymeniacidonis]|uniref:Glutamine cyclotransferase n=1 Tax=Actinoalloteichus hymeniacidonis TaxID=340345 RepID=A0AAC9N162_9PSEU|nr:glutaminyl-peptide cyclotransferase [Actinoalloteichus hymeniacidonis]AOS65822.1 glutamine cyclotransferase [Actinoalloteichus hymeniacidonis]MBB5906087.1 glutaminyl-peptide cyclotransferase [Actinoalloteichus hymeniacidonis]